MAGIWPYGDEKMKWVSRFVILVITVTAMTTQVAYVKVNLSTDTVIEQCPFFTMGLGIFLKELNYIIHEQQLRKLLGCVFADWIVKRPKPEMDIMDKYAKRGLFFSRLYVANGIFCYVLFTAVAITPRVLDLISPKNESRGVGFIYPANYGVDEEEHYYYLMGHMLSVITVVFFVYISCDTIYMNIVQHACGLLNLSGTRSFMINYTEVDDTYRKVRHSIKAHQHAME
ncbi:PREDICTED: uncharacterized protein LOC108576159 [Habropoda laboriosa]|uniref:uncharacterized protein LOC108576159 n=1 Tax=Habropoda laboriosa TaxID=597456 RepID=UPI00083E60DE|nr:PREDICTED: uncharacterized protein LOC108576159 [Habropoda laboriosa]